MIKRAEFEFHKQTDEEFMDYIEDMLDDQNVGVRRDGNTFSIYQFGRKIHEPSKRSIILNFIEKYEWQALVGSFVFAYLFWAFSVPIGLYISGLIGGVGIIMLVMDRYMRRVAEKHKDKILENA